MNLATVWSAAKHALGYDVVEQPTKRRQASTNLRSEDAELTSQKRKHLIAQSQDLLRNFSVARWAVGNHLDFVSRFSFASQTKTDFDYEFQQRMNEWMLDPKRCDIRAQHTFPRMLRMTEARAVSFPTLADLIKLNDQNLSDIEVTDLLQAAPLLAALAAVPASNGTNHSYLKETGAPVVGFRAVNAGRFNSTDTDTKVEIALQILDASFTVDKALADAYQKGGAPAFLARRGKRSLRAAFQGAEKQIIYGTGNDADGFVGTHGRATDSIERGGSEKDCYGRSQGPGRITRNRAPDTAR